jgi:hypothetical protein
MNQQKFCCKENVMERSKEEIEFAFETFVVGVQKLVDKYQSENFPTLDRVEIEVNPGRKYWKVVRYNHRSRTVFGFVRKSDGAILKASNWNAPFTKGPSAVRGYVNDSSNGLNSVTPYGVVYAR